LKGETVLRVPENLWNMIRNWIPMPCVDIVIFNEENKFLLLKRNNEPFKDEWWVPGGKIKRGDFPLEDFVVKKVKEETGLDVTIVRMLGVFHYDYHNKENSFDEEDLIVAFLARRIGGEIKIDSQHSKYKWFNQINEDMNPYLKDVLKRAIENN
jgi:ADP-ribose pyrophosphatase YjhB (NUDIX family)